MVLFSCNWRLTMFDIITFLSSDCRAQALKLSEHLKKGPKKFFVFILQTLTLTHFFCIFSLTLISYLKSLLNLFDEYNFLKYQWLSWKWTKIRFSQKVYLPLKPTWHSCFFSFSLTQPKTYGISISPEIETILPLCLFDSVSAL